VEERLNLLETGEGYVNSILAVKKFWDAIRMWIGGVPLFILSKFLSFGRSYAPAARMWAFARIREGEPFYSYWQ